MKILLSILFILTLVTPAAATRYWADPTGNNFAVCANIDGSSDPGAGNYGTINRAVVCATASGDEVFIKPGTYTANTTISNPASGITIQGSDSSKANWPLVKPTGSIGAMVNFNNITLSNITVQFIKWDLINTTSAGNCISNSSDAFITNFTLQDFECLGPPVGSATDTGSGIRSASSASSWIVRRGKVARWHSLDGQPGAHGFYWSSDNGLIEDMEIDDVNGYGIQLYSSAAGVSANDVIFRRNKITNVTKACILLEGEGSGHALYNNTCANWGGTLGINFGGTSNHLINNVFYHTANTIGISITSCAGTCQIANNIVSVGGTAISGSDPQVVLTTNKTSGGAACMVNPGAGDYSLVEGSACKNAGTSIASTGLWPGHAGRFNGTAPDQGAHEVPQLASCSASGNTLSLLFNNNLFPPIANPSTTGTSVTVDGSGRTLSSPTVVGTNQVNMTFSGAAVSASASSSGSASPISDSANLGGISSNDQKVANWSAVGCGVAGGGATITQTHFRGHQLYGPEATPLCLTPSGSCTNMTDVSFSIQKGGCFRCRLKMAATGGNPPNAAYIIRYSRNGGGFTVVPDAFDADNFRFYGSTDPDPNIPTQGTETTEILASSHSTNEPGAILRISAAIPNIDLSQDSESEMEGVFCIDVDEIIGTTFKLRIYNQDGTALNSIAQEPTITVVEPGLAHMGGM